MSVKKLDIYTPFNFSEKLDPRNIVTVGDQTLSEHIFAAHFIRNPRHGILDVMSKFSIDHETKTISLDVKKDVYLSNGSKLSIEEISESLEKSFRGTSHSNLKDLLVKIEHKNNTIFIKMSDIPTNIEALFSLPDFFIYPKEVFLNNNEFSSTGPYKLESLSSERVSLILNPFYPKDLRANEISEVNIHTMRSESIIDFFRDHKDESYLLAYFGGYYIENGELDFLSHKKLIASTFPNEWVMLIGFNNPEIPLKDRETLSNYINGFRKKILEDSPLAQSAYSVSPSDRPYGLNHDDVSYTPADSILTRKVTIGVRERDKNKKLVKNLINVFSSIENVEFMFFEDSSDIYLKTDAYLGAQGISAGDPVHHMNFFLKFEPLFKKIMSQEELNRIATSKSVQEFNAKVKDLELRVHQNRAILPIAHFPGIVVHSDNLKPDENLVGDWGIRAWTYQILR